MRIKDFYDYLRIKDFYDYLRKREVLRIVRAAGQPWPWTDDPILQKYRFTNVKRTDDRTTKELRELYQRGVNLHRDDENLDEQFLLNCAIGRYFGRSEFFAALGWQDDFREDVIRSKVQLLRASGESVFTAAYVISNLGESRPKVEVVLDFLGYLWDARMRIITAIYESDWSWQAGIKEMQTVRGYGGSGFMAKEILLDTMLIPGVIWETGIPSDRDTWCPAGPGAQRGCRRILGEKAGPMGQTLCLPVMREIFGERKTYWDPFHPDTPLELHDVQFGLCEFDKYERARLREGLPKRQYHRPR